MVVKSKSNFMILLLNQLPYLDITLAVRTAWFCRDVGGATQNLLA